MISTHKHVLYVKTQVDYEPQDDTTVQQQFKQQLNP